MGGVRLAKVDGLKVPFHPHVQVSWWYTIHSFQYYIVLSLHALNMQYINHIWSQIDCWWDNVMDNKVVLKMEHIIIGLYNITKNISLI